MPRKAWHVAYRLRHQTGQGDDGERIQRLGRDERAGLVGGGLVVTDDLGGFADADRFDGHAEAVGTEQMRRLVPCASLA